MKDRLPNDIFQPQLVAPDVLLVAPNMEQQRRATLALVRPAQVAPIARELAASIGPAGAEGDVIARWLGRLRFFDDPPGVDIWRGPLATLAAGGGDCEDLSMMGLSLLLALGGYGVLLVGILFTHHGPIGHAWMEGWDSAGWLQLDATNGLVMRACRSPAYIPFAVYPPG